MINWNGQILPVKKIAREAHARGIEVVVDSAHTFAHLDYTIEDLECDYWATSLHKWLCAPFGSGLLYVKKEKIANLYPLFAAPEPESDNIRKFENLGTRSFAIEQAIGHAVNFFHFEVGQDQVELALLYKFKSIGTALCSEDIIPLFFKDVYQVLQGNSFIIDN